MVMRKKGTVMMAKGTRLLAAWCLLLAVVGATVVGGQSEVGGHSAAARLVRGVPDAARPPAPPSKATELASVPSTRRVLVPLLAWERATGGKTYDRWFAAMKTAGYAVDYVDKVPKWTPKQMLERYDAVALTTRSASVGVLQPGFAAALEEFVRQGGGLILVQTADREAWIYDPINLLLPTTFYDTRGYGWNTRYSLHQVRATPGGVHPATAGIDWKSAPPLEWMFQAPPPSHEFFRGTLQLLQPRQGLTKPLLNNDWKVVLRADDLEHSPLAVTSSYGRGRILLWGAAFGEDPQNQKGPSPFSEWAGFAPAWGKFLTWTAGAGKVAAPQPGVWIVGDAIDNPTGKEWSGESWAYWRNVSYAMPDFGLSRAPSAKDAGAALVLKAGAAQEAALAQLAKAGKPLMVCDPGAWRGALKPLSPLTEKPEAPSSTMPPLTLGKPGAQLQPSPAKAEPSPAQIKPLPHAALQPPRTWKVKATGSEVFGRDLKEKWFAPGYDSSAFQKQPLGAMTQDVGGQATGHDGAIWYRAEIDMPADIPADAVWTFRGPSYASLRAWANGIAVPIETGDRTGAGDWLLRLKTLKPGKQVLALRLYKSASADYWEGSRRLYTNTGLTTARAERRPVSGARPPVFDLSSPNGLIPLPVTSKLPPDAPLLFSSRADGDKAFRIPFTLTAEQARRSPLLIFDEPGLIRQVRINGQPVARIKQGAWDGVSGGNTSAFLLRGVLRAGKNTLDFHPDFSRLRNLAYPVAAEVSTRSSLPRLEWTGELQTLEALDPALAPHVPDRLFKPGAVRAPAPGAKVVLRWNDGRPALVRRGQVMAWTSDVTAQLNASVVHKWHVSWEAMSSWDFNAADTLPRGDSLLWENAAPLISAALAQASSSGSPQLKAVRPVLGQRELEVEIANSGPKRSVLLSYRMLNWLGSMVANEAKLIELAAHGMTKVRLPVPVSGFAGETMKPEWQLLAALRSADNLTGFNYLEKVVEMPPAVRVAIAADSPLQRFAAGALPNERVGSPGYRGRNLWWPQLNEDPGSSVYLDGETAHLRVTLHNETAIAQSVPVTVELRAQIRGRVEKRLQQTVEVPPQGRKTLELEAKLTGEFEPYLVRVHAGKSVAEQSRVLYAIRPWKRNFSVDRPPIANGLSFGTMHPFSNLQQPDNILPTPPLGINAFTPQSTKWVMEWLRATATDAQGGGGGVNGFQGLTEGLGWGPFDQSHATNAPNQMSLFPNGQPMMHYVAEGMRRRHYGPARFEIVDFWTNLSVPFNWNSLASFRDWLAANHPRRLRDFAPGTLLDAEKTVRTKFASEWNEWQDAVVIGSWGAVRDTAAPGSLFWDQADHSLFLTDGLPSMASKVTDGRPIANFLAELLAAGDMDPGTARMGLGYRYRSYGEEIAAALVPHAHFNVSSLRHVDFINEQRMANMGNATPETYRAYAYDTVWAASVKPDGTLRAVVDTPVSEVLNFPNPPYSGLKYGNILYDRIYRLASVVEPQQALGVLWVAPIGGRTPATVDGRALYETLRNNGVPLSAAISPEYLSVAPKTGAAGLVYLLPPQLKADDLKALRDLARQKFPVVCLVAADAKAAAAQLPLSFTVVKLPTVFSPGEAQRMATSINEATGRALTASAGVCVYGFRAVQRAFVVAQNMRPHAREVEVEVDDKAAGVAGATRAVSLNDNSELVVNKTAGRTKVKILLGPWDAVLVVLVPSAAKERCFINFPVFSARPDSSRQEALRQR